MVLIFVQQERDSIRGHAFVFVIGLTPGPWPHCTGLVEGACCDANGSSKSFGGQRDLVMRAEEGVWLLVFKLNSL